MTSGMREPFPGYPPPLTARPEGLLDLLGLQTNGAYPQHLSYNSLDCGIDLLRWYLESRATFKTGNITTGAGGTFYTDGTNLTVPAGQHWVLLNFSVVSTASTGATGAKIVPARANSSGLTRVLLGQDSNATNSFLSASSDAGMLGYLLRPTVQVGLIDLKGDAVTYTYTLRYVPVNT